MAKAASKTEELFLKNTLDGTIRRTSRGIWDMVKTKPHPHKKTALYQLVDANKKVIDEYDLLAAAEAVKKNAADADKNEGAKIIGDAEKQANAILSDARAKADQIIKDAETKALELIKAAPTTADAADAPIPAEKTEADNGPVANAPQSIKEKVEAKAQAEKK